MSSSNLVAPLATSTSLPYAFRMPNDDLTMLEIENLFVGDDAGYVTVDLQIDGKEVSIFAYKAVLHFQQDRDGHFLPQGNTLIITENLHYLPVKQWFNVDNSTWCLSIGGRHFTIGGSYAIIEEDRGGAQAIQEYFAGIAKARALKEVAQRNSQLSGTMQDVQSLIRSKHPGFVEVTLQIEGKDISLMAYKAPLSETRLLQPGSTIHITCNPDNLHVYNWVDREGSYYLSIGNQDFKLGSWYRLIKEVCDQSTEDVRNSILKTLRPLKG